MRGVPHAVELLQSALQQQFLTEFGSSVKAGACLAFFSRVSYRRAEQLCVCASGSMWN